MKMKILFSSDQYTVKGKSSRINLASENNKVGNLSPALNSVIKIRKIGDEVNFLFTKNYKMETYKERIWNT